ncbi:MAG TPA: plastocyanin/azurin family copper-binding protein [Candidatus Dormibacteraeota bacterium]|nr:plastocyanin/azurin family copper-binding protein [Candidatus Dormibacteraeota bacterium]
MVVPTMAMVVGAAFQLATPVAAGGGGCHIGVREGRVVRAEIVNLCFDPDIIRVAPGETVTWTNRDQTDHTVTGVAGAFGSYEVIRPGASVASTFSHDGLYPFFCVLHPGMVGVVSVGTGTGPGAASGKPAAAPAAAVTRSQPQVASGLGFGALPLAILGLAAAAGLGFRVARVRR